MPVPGPGEALVEVSWLSIDPTIRGWMESDTYLPAIELGAPIRAAGLGTVVESHVDSLPVGSTVFGMMGWQEHAIVGPGTRLIPDGIDPQAALSVFGITGLTAYVGLLDIGRPKEGVTVLVSGAAGATGSVVGQIARIKGCRVVGIAGTDEKCTWLTDELGFDGAINYRTQDVSTAIGERCPDGVDLFFDNVGGKTISQYNDTEPQPGQSNLLNVIGQRARMEGFVVIDHLHEADRAIADLSAWVLSGDLTYAVDVVEGLDAAPAALDRLFTGANTGKVVLHL